MLDNRLRTPAGPNRLSFLYGCLRELHDATDGRLVIRTGPPATKVRALAREVGADRVYCAEDFGPYGSTRDEDVERALEKDGGELHRVGSPYAVAPGEVMNKGGDNFKVFTPFSRAWRAHGWDAPVRRPRSITWATGIPSDPLPDSAEDRRRAACAGGACRPPAPRRVPRRTRARLRRRA